MSPPRLRARDDDAARDRALLARHVEGDRDAFGELVRHHQDRLWRVALRTLGTRTTPRARCRTHPCRRTALPAPTAATPRLPPGCTASWSTPASTSYGAGRHDRRRRSTSLSPG